MRICIVGGGKVGFYLAKTLLEHRQDVVMIEPERPVCEYIANTLDIKVIEGDGTSVDTLELAGCGGCETLVAVTGRDEDNLVACQLAKREFRCRRTVARVNNPRNAEVLKKLGVDIVVSSTDNIVRALEREVETSAVRHLLNMAGGAASLLEMRLPEDFRYAGRTLTDIPVPENFNIVSVSRGEELIIPRGGTRLQPGDGLMCIATDEAFRNVVREWKLPGV